MKGVDHHHQREACGAQKESGGSTIIAYYSLGGEAEVWLGERRAVDS